MTGLVACAIAWAAAGVASPPTGREVVNRRLDLLVETGSGLRRITLTATFGFEVMEHDTARSWFSFPPAERPEQLVRVELDGVPLVAGSLEVAREDWGPRFVLPATLRPGSHRLTVTGSWPEADRLDFTHWGSWHPYLGSRALPVPITLEVHTDTAYQVVASGTRLADSVQGVRRIARWRTTLPQGWMFLSIGHYRQAELTEGAERVTVFWPPDHAAFSPELMSREPFRVLRFLRDAFGPPATDHLSLIQIPGDEVTNFVVDGLVAISRGSYARLESSPAYLSGMLAHELAHLWWGDLVNAVGPGARWLTEGFAEYTRYRYERAVGGEPLAWSYRNLLTVRQFAGRASPPLAGPEAVDEDELLYYQKGAFVLHLLAGEIGQDSLGFLLRRFVNRFRGRTAKVEDFIATSGGGLRWFFDQWLRRPDGPRLRLSATAEASGDGVQVRGAVEQSAPAYRLRLPLVIYGARDTLRQTINLEGSRAEFAFRLPDRPLRVALDPEASVFKWFTENELPLEFADASRRVTTGRCVFPEPSDDTTLSRRRGSFLARRFPNVTTTDPQCPIRVLVGREAAAHRHRYAPSVPDPVAGAMSAFVVRSPDGAGVVVGVEGDVEAWPDLLFPEAPLTFLRVRDGQIIAARGAALPRIEVRF